jgi:formylglycine-generating enzyme required for sulfatase activity
MKVVSDLSSERLCGIIVLGLLVGLAGCGPGLFSVRRSPAAASLHDTWIRPADGMMMVYVPAGEFEMGSLEGARDEQPVHTVVLDAFWIDRTEVSNAQFAAFLNERGNQVEGDVTWLAQKDEDSLIEQVGTEYRPKHGYGDHPVVEVPWYGAAAYCDWAEARLPTEAEWEYAARGPEERELPWAGKFDGTRLNYCDANCEEEWADDTFDDGYAVTAPVGSYPEGASWCDALDMAGNAAEWVADWYADYLPKRQVNPKGPSFRAFRVVRGGSWYNVSIFVRSAVRSPVSPEVSFSKIGFRCAKGLR